jgi:surfeit locus 1 family protein
VDLSLAAVGTDLDQRRVTARGSYDHERTFVLRNRVERETPGVFLATPLRLEGRPEAVLVLRGFVPAQDALRPDGGSIERPASAAVEGIALPVPISADSGGRLEARGTVTWRRLDLNSLQRELPYPVLEVFVHATRDSGFEPRTHPWPVVASLPPLNDGPHLSYMIQWFGIGAVALGFGIAFVRRPG